VCFWKARNRWRGFRAGTAEKRRAAHEEGIEALVEAAEEEGIIEPEASRLIEQWWNLVTSAFAK